MPVYALVRNGVFEELRLLEADQVPQHKFDIDGGLILRPYIDNGLQSYQSSLLETLTESYVVTPTEVTKVYDIQRKSIEEQKALVKAEARRRITHAYPDWKQANMTARAVELQDLHRQNNSWTAEEEAEQSQILAAWAWIKNVRVVSDQIENMDPIPLDFMDDSYWQ